MSWFKENGWFYDKRDHCWKKVSGEKSEIDEVIDNSPRRSSKARHQLTDSCPFTNTPIFERVFDGKKPFTKVNNTIIFNNGQYPLRFLEVEP